MTKDDFEDQAMALADTMYRVSSMLLRRPQDRQDAMQSCLLRAWQNRHQLRKMDRFKPWLMRILVNECHTLLRKSRSMVLTHIPQRQEARLGPGITCVEALPFPWRWWRCTTWRAGLWRRYPRPWGFPPAQ